MAETMCRLDLDPSYGTCSMAASLPMHNDSCSSPCVRKVLKPRKEIMEDL